MKLESKHISILLVVTYLCIAIPLIFSIYTFPTDLSEILEIENDSAKALLEKKTWNLSMYVIAELTIGLLGMIYLTRQIMHRNTTLRQNIQEINQSVGVETEVKKESKPASSEPSIEDQLDLLKSSISEELSNFFTIDKFLSVLAKHFELSQAAYYSTTGEDEDKKLLLTNGYAYYAPDNEEISYSFGQGLPGQAAKSQKTILIKSVPEDQNQVFSGLGQSAPTSLAILPILLSGKTTAVVELASFKKMGSKDIAILEEIMIEFNNKLTGNTEDV